MKRTIAILLAALMLGTLFAGCSGSGTTSTTAAATTTAAAETTAAAAETTAAAAETTAAAAEATTAVSGDEVTLDVYLFQAWVNASDIWADDAPGNFLVEELRKRTGVSLNVTGVEYDQQQVHFVSGELGDLAMIFTGADVQTLMESDMLTPLNDLVETYCTNIASLRTERWETAIKTYGDGTNAYALPIQSGNEGTARQNGRYIYTLRYDHWEELGFPEWSNWHEYLDDVKKLTELHPTTDEGLTTIGISVNNESTTSTSSFENRMYGTYGFGEANSAGSIQVDIATGELVSNYVDENSAYWQSVDFYRYAYQIGILDPDWAVQTAEQLTEKQNAGRIISSDTYVNGTTYIDSKLESDPDYLGGWVNIPVKGTMFYQNAQQLAGWELCFWAVPTSAEHPVEAIKFLDYCFGYEGGRLITNGIEGVHWDYNESGEPYLTDAYVNLTDSEKNVFSLFSDFFRGLSNATACPDGGTVNLTYSPTYFASITTEPWLVAYDEHYGITWPNQKFVEYSETGYTFDRSRYDQRIVGTMGIYEDTMQRIDSLCVTAAASYMARLVMAADDAEFATLKAQLLDELAGYGVDTLFEYASGLYENACEELGIEEYLATFPAVQR